MPNPSDTHVNTPTHSTAQELTTTDLIRAVDCGLAAVNNWGEYADRQVFSAYDRNYTVEDTDIKIIVADDLTEPTPIRISVGERAVFEVGDVDYPEDTLKLFEPGDWMDALFREVEELS